MLNTQPLNLSLLLRLALTRSFLVKSVRFVVFYVYVNNRIKSSRFKTVGESFQDTLEKMLTWMSSTSRMLSLCVTGVLPFSSQLILPLQNRCTVLLRWVGKINCNQYSIEIFFTFCSLNALEPLLF